MAFYYVVDTGTAGATDAGRFATRQTGAFTDATSYSDIATVLNGNGSMTDYAVGDTICVSSAHSFSLFGTLSYVAPAGGVTIIESVDDSNRENLKVAAAAQETGTSSGGDVLFGAGAADYFLYGLWFKCNDNIGSGSTNVRVLARNCIFEVTGSTDIACTLNQDGNYWRLEDCDLKLSDAGAHAFAVSNGGVLEVVGGQTSGSAFTDMFSAWGLNGGGSFYATGFDMSSGASTANIMSDYGNSATVDDTVLARLHNCKVPASAVLVEETQAVSGSLRLFEFSGVDDTDAYRYHYEDNLGEVAHNTTTYVTGDVDLEGPGGYSYLINTVSDCSKFRPFRWELPVGYGDLSVASTDTVRVRITSATSLTQEDVAVFIGTSNTTNNTDMNLLSSIETTAESSTWLPDHTVTTGTELANDNSQWTSAQTNEYAITVTPTSVDATSPLAPTVWIEVYADALFYVSSELVIEA